MLVRKIDWLGIAVFIFLGILWTYKISLIPYGFFCDEAMAAIRGYELIQRDFSGFISPFFYKHFHYLVGSFTVYPLVPFIKFIGLNELAVRMAALTYSFGYLIVIYFCLRELKVRVAGLVILLFGVTPWVMLQSRIFFGHSFSLLMILLGYFCYLIASRRKNGYYSLGAGVCFGLSMYGYGAFLIASPLFVFLIIISEISFNCFRWFKYKNLFLVLLTFCVLLSPIALTALNNQNFFRRLVDKGGYPNLLNGEKLISIIKNYPKYYSWDYLFSKGEVGMPGGLISRHSVSGAGMLLKVYAPLLLLAWIVFLIKKDNRKVYFLPFFLLFLVYPLPDIITTSLDKPPYSFAVYSNISFLPFIAGYSLDYLDKFSFKIKIFGYLKYHFFTILLFLVVLLEGTEFYTNKFLGYPLFSSGFWGWQSGPREMISFFRLHQKEYDQFVMEGVFNEPQVFLDFYLPEKDLRKKAIIGSPDNSALFKKQLFGLSSGTYKSISIKQKYKVVKTIYYPNGEQAFYLLSNNTL